ncbi:MAG: hypothetical protein ACREMZ_06970 [Gemmatimonadales bacterium]
MIIYRDQHRLANPRRLLSDLRSTGLRLGSSNPVTHEAAVDALIGLGALESAVDDVIFPDADGIDPLAQRLRDASVALGHVLWHTWRQQPLQAERWWEQSAASIAGLELQWLPSTVEITVPEGYAYYAVYPELYLEAARRCHAELGPFDAVLLGLRSIGVSLSAAVAGSLEELGCRVVSYTLRPRGHPFSRHPILTGELAVRLAAERDAYFLVIDEGPGLSGSSIGGTAGMLGALGIHDDRIILLPSWQTDGSGLRSSIAREQWRRHRQISVSFEEVLLDSGRLTQALPAGPLRDLSAGAWRTALYPEPGGYPPIQPQHERRKYLLEPAGSSRPGPEPVLLRFAGLGGYSGPKLHRAERLADAGFSPRPLGLVHGFLVQRFVPGAPVSSERIDARLLETIARYLAHLSLEHAAEPSVANTVLREMIAHNVDEGLGDEWLRLVDTRLRNHPGDWNERPAALDGRMLPHEWIRTDSGYLKTDSIDHHDDHFFPGCQDIAWDLAAACLEFDLDSEERRWLVERYRVMSRDRTITARLPLQAISYLAFRLGYATLASSVLGRTPDGKQFAAAAGRYASLLRRELIRTAGEHWNV